jgi:DNA polymerase-3 subunit beta
MSKSEYPAFPDLSTERSIKMNGATLKGMLSRTAFAAAKDDSRQILNGVFVELTPDKMTLVGTDGKRLAKVYESIATPFEDKTNFVIPLKAVDEMIRMLGNDEDVEFTVMQDKVAIESQGMCLITKLLSGQYPDVDRVIPDPSEMKQITLHKEELSTLLKQVSLFTSEMNYSVRFIFQEGDLHLQAIASDIGEGKVNMPVDYSDEKLEIAFNPYFFLDILRHCKDETTSFAVSDSYNPGLLRDSSNATYVIMPMRLSAE